MPTGLLYGTTTPSKRCGCLMVCLFPVMLQFRGAYMVFVIPSEVDSNGAFISHDILGSSRKRRSLPHRHNLTVHYKLSAFGKELLLDLKPSNVIANGFTIQTLGRDGVTTLQEPRFENCFYQGLIRNHSISSAAISTCTGLLELVLVGRANLFSTPFISGSLYTIKQQWPILHNNERLQCDLAEVAYE
ncbi:ATS18 metalloproteinase, partial [Polypterus senegalus]